MALLFLVATLLVVTTPSNQVPMEVSGDIHPVAQELSNLRKRAEESQNGPRMAFIEEKLVQHSQALEQLLRMTQAHNEDLKQLIENISKSMEPVKPKLPVKIEVQPSRRSGGIVSTDKPRTWSSKLPQYGALLRNLFVDEYTHDSEPTVVIEESYIPDQGLQGRSGDEKP